MITTKGLRNCKFHDPRVYTCAREWPENLYSENALFLHKVSSYYQIRHRSDKYIVMMTMEGYT